MWTTVLRQGNQYLVWSGSRASREQSGERLRKEVQALIVVVVLHAGEGILAEVEMRGEVKVVGVQGLIEDGGRSNRPSLPRLSSTAHLHLS